MISSRLRANRVLGKFIHFLPIRAKLDTVVGAQESQFVQV